MGFSRKYIIRGAALAILGGATYYASPRLVGISPADRPYIKAVYSAPLSLDPAQMDETSSLVVSNLIYDGLLSFTPNLELQGAIAESWSTSRDGKTLKFKLRKNAKFQSGETVTAQDVIHSFERLMAPQSKVYSYYDCIAGADDFHLGKSQNVSGLRTNGSEQVEITLKYPFPPFLSVLAGATAKVLPRNVDGPEFFKAPIGSGPFRYVKLEKKEKITDTILDRFDGYYGDSPKVSRIVLRAMPEKDALIDAKSGQIDDLANFPLNGKEDVFEKGRDVTAPVAATWIIGLNTRLPPFNDPNVRRAFRDSVDTDKFRKLIHPDAIQANGYIPPGLPGYQRSYRHKANKVSKSVSQKSIRIAIPEVLAKSDEMKRFFESSLQAQGWNVEVVPMEWGQLMKGYSDKTLQAFLVSMNMDYPDTEFLVRNFESTNSDNFSGVRDEKVDSLIRKARETQDRVRRQSIYVELVERLHDLAVTVNLFHPRGHYWVSDCVSGFSPDILADVYIDYRTVALKSDCSRQKVAGRDG